MLQELLVQLLITKITTYLYSSTSCFQTNFSFSTFCDLLILPLIGHSSLLLIGHSSSSPLHAGTPSPLSFSPKLGNKKIVTRKVSNKVSTSDRFPLYTQFIQGWERRGGVSYAAAILQIELFVEDKETNCLPIPF